MNMMNLELSPQMKKHIDMLQWIEENIPKVMAIPDYMFGEGKEDWEIEIVHREFLKKYNLL